MNSYKRQKKHCKGQKHYLRIEGKSTPDKKAVKIKPKIIEPEGKIGGQRQCNQHSEDSMPRQLQRRIGEEPRGESGE